MVSRDDDLRAGKEQAESRPSGGRPGPLRGRVKNVVSTDSISHAANPVGKELSSANTFQPGARSWASFAEDSAFPGPRRERRGRGRGETRLANDWPPAKS